MKHILTAVAFAFLAAGCGGGTEAAGSGGSSASTSKIAGATIDEVGTMSRQLLEDVTGALGKVTDAASAKKTKPELEKIAQRAVALRDRREELTGAEASNKLKFAQDTMAMMGQISSLTDQFERLEGVPGVRAELDDVMSRIMEFFDTRR